MPKAILRVLVERRYEDGPDLSCLGEYSSQWKEGAIDRKERGDWKRGDFEYFIPAMSAKETGNPNSPEEDYARYESYNANKWCMLCVGAKAVVLLSNRGVVQTIKSGGLYGVESDGGEEYLEEIGQEQLNELRAELLDAGFSDNQITESFKSVEVVQ